MWFVWILWLSFGHGWAGVSYTTTYSLDSQDSALRAPMEDVSYLKSLQDRLPDTLEELKWRAERDKIQLERFLYGKGYMKANVTIDVGPMVSDKEPVVVEVKIQPGDAFTYHHIYVESQDAPSWFKSSMIETDTMSEGARVDYSHIQHAQEKLEKEAKQQGHPWAMCAKPIVDVHEDPEEVELTFPMVFGPKCTMGATTIEGLQNVNAMYVRNRLAWKEGQTFDQRLVDQARETLIATTLFSEVDIQCIPRTGDETLVDVIIKLKEAPARSIGAGLRYATSEGIGGRIFWRHKNVGGRAHIFEIGSRRTKLQTRTEAKWDVPDFWVPQQTLSHAAFMSVERQRAYRGHINGGSILLGRELWSRWTGKVGVLVDRAKLRQNETRFQSRLIGVPVQLHFDGSNNLLDPSRGIRLSGWGTPYWGRVNDAGRGFVSTRFHASGYLPLSSAYRGSEPVVVLAGFGRLGKIMGKNLYYVPPHQRFYAGGSDSIRAYGPQMLGPLDNHNIPMGGLFLSEYGGEVRLRTSENMGLVAFAEAGSLTNDGVLNFINHLKSKPLWGGGIGFRYYTPLGPIRADIAFPMSRRRNILTHRYIDAPYQFYISFGQAF